MVEKPEWASRPFYSHDLIHQQLQEWAVPHGIPHVSVRDSKKRSPDADGLSDFPYQYCEYRCKPTLCSGKAKKDVCGFRFRYKYSEADQCIHVSIFELPMSSCHLSGWGSSALSSTGITNVTSESQLTAEEKDFLIRLGPDRLRVEKVRVTLSRTSGTHRCFCRHLLLRVMSEGRKKFTGPDKDSMNQFMSHCFQIQSMGGSFDYDFCDASRKLKSFHTQTVLERELVEVYGKSLFFFDTTYHTTKYDLLLLPPTSIDCLGHICPLGMGLIDAESKAATRASLDRFHLANKGAVAGTDRAPGWEEPMEEAGIDQYFDSYHMSKNIVETQGGLGSSSDAYSNGARHAITGDFGTDEKLLAHIEETKRHAGAPGSASHNMLKTIIEERQKMCYTHVGELFCCSSKAAASPGESVMNRYKGGGHLKEDVKRWNLYDLVLHHERLTASYVGRAVEKLKALIRERRHCSDYVTEKINEETAKLINYQVVDVETNSCHEDGSLVGTTFRIKKKTGDDKPTHSIFLPDDQSCHPFCSCRRYKTFLLPCRHILRAMSDDTSGRVVSTKNFLHPQWWLDRHPLYRFAMRDITGSATIVGTLGLPIVAAGTAPMGPMGAFIYVRLPC